MSLESVRSKVQQILTEELGSVRIGRDGTVMLENESAAIFIDVIDWGDGDTIVKVISPMLSDVRLTPEVFRWVAVEGQQLWFGHARVSLSDGDTSVGTIGFEWDLLGNTLDPDELMAAVRSVAIGANKLDDELQAKFGGKRWADR
jgi:hypothetical protein